MQVNNVLASLCRLFMIGLCAVFGAAAIFIGFGTALWVLGVIIKVLMS